ncbi:MAG: hypothetical protein RL021_2217 [Bacteroidota bacterium]|jgi:sugar transferase (PEP-CTERM/EpsH1 system associated)
MPFLVPVTVNILCITSRVPWPLEKGDKLRVYHQLRELSARHRVHLFAITDEAVHPEAMVELKKFCASVEVHRHSLPAILLNLLQAMLKGIPYQVGYFTSAAARRRFRRYAAGIRPDVCFFQLIRTAGYRYDVSDVPAVLDYMDVFSKGVERRIHQVPWWKRWLFRSEWKRLLFYEAEVFRWFEGHTVISAQDRDWLPVMDRAAVKVVPNGVDTTRFHPMDRSKEFELLFNGNMNYPPNIESAVFLVKEVLPLVHKARPEVRLLISGADPSPEVRALAGPAVTVTGWVDDVRESFARSRMLVAPMTLSIGLQNKLLEAMAMRLPCITTPLSNNALGARDGVEVLLAVTAEEFARQILRLLDDAEFSERIAANGLRLVQERFSWDGSVRILEAELTRSVTE